MTGELRVVTLRGDFVESSHAVSVAVCTSDGHLRASSGSLGRVTVLRSAAKPFQALPILTDGAAERFAVSDDELALACASHNSERSQVALVASWLERIGCAESDLACGPHPPLSRELSIRGPDTPKADPAPRSPMSSNCSGKHTGMLTLAKHHGWELEGYNHRGHPVQERILETLSEFVDFPAGWIGQAVDGCAAVTFALPLTNAATGFARLVSWSDAAPKRVVKVMTTRPGLVAGHGRLCTDLMEAFPGKVLAKVGAEGVYGAALVDQGLGIALKVESGDWRACNVALLSVLEQLGLDLDGQSSLDRYRRIPVRNTRRHDVGLMEARGEIAIS
jgi:L-asparaginase II